MWIIIVGRDIIVFKFLHYSCIYSLPLFPPPNFFFKSGFKLELISAWCEFRCARGCARVFYTAFFQASFEIFVCVKFTILECTDFFFFLLEAEISHSKCCALIYGARNPNWVLQPGCDRTWTESWGYFLHSTLKNWHWFPYFSAKSCPL